MSTLTSEELLQLLEQTQKPPCAALTPMTITEIDSRRGFVSIAFPPQPAFENHFGNVQGGFAVAYVDALASIAAFARVQQWCPSIEFKTNFLAPWKLGQSRGEGLITRAGKRVVFCEAKVWGPDNALCVTASGTLLVPG